MARINSNGNNRRREKVENHHPWESGFRVPLICEDQLFLSIENRVRSRSAQLTGHRSAASGRYQADRDIGSNGLLL